MVYYTEFKYKKENGKSVQIAFLGGNFLGLKSEEAKSLLDQAADFVGGGWVDGIFNCGA